MSTTSLTTQRIILDFKPSILSLYLTLLYTPDTTIRVQQYFKRIT